MPRTHLPMTGVLEGLQDRDAGFVVPAWLASPPLNHPPTHLPTTGVLEGLEECDVGDERDGDGCSAACTVEPGWTCTHTSPSVCTQTGAAKPHGGPPGADPHIGPSSGGGSGGTPPAPPSSGQPSRHKRRGWVVVVALAAVGAVLGAAWGARQYILDSFPGLELAAAAVSARLPGRRQLRYDFAGAFDWLDGKGGRILPWSA